MVIFIGGDRFKATGILDVLTMKGMFQAFLSPLPWGAIRFMEPLSTPFYWIYWLLLPYTLYALLRHFRSNINWHLFVYIMILYVVGGAIGDPPRKRLIVYPILVTWVLAHLAHKRWVRSGQPQYETEEINAIRPEYHKAELLEDMEESSYSV